VSDASQPTAAEPAVHMVRMLWSGRTIRMRCGCGWAAEVAGGGVADSVDLRGHYRAADRVAAAHQYPTVDPAPTVADELWARLHDWPVVLR